MKKPSVTTVLKVVGAGLGLLGTVISNKVEFHERMTMKADLKHEILEELLSEKN